MTTVVFRRGCEIGPTCVTVAPASCYNQMIPLSESPPSGRHINRWRGPLTKTEQGPNNRTPAADRNQAAVKEVGCKNRVASKLAQSHNKPDSASDGAIMKVEPLVSANQAWPRTEWWTGVGRRHRAGRAYRTAESTCSPIGQ